MCVYLFIYTYFIYTVHTHILCKQKLILDVINRLTALIYIYIYIIIDTHKSFTDLYLIRYNNLLKE